jgi:hypothetical protein
MAGEVDQLFRAFLRPDGTGNGDAQWAPAGRFGASRRRRGR